MGKLVTAEKLNRLWQNGIKPLAEKVDKKADKDNIGKMFSYDANTKTLTINTKI